MPAKLTATLYGEEIPGSFAARLSEHPIPGMRYRMILVPVEETDEEKLASLRADVRKGREQLAAGLGIDGDEVFAQLRARFPSPDDE